MNVETDKVCNTEQIPDYISFVIQYCLIVDRKIFKIYLVIEEANRRFYKMQKRRIRVIQLEIILCSVPFVRIERMAVTTK